MLSLSKHIWACSGCAWKDTVGYGPVEKKRRLGQLVDFPKPHAPISRLFYSLCRKLGKGLSRPTGMNRAPDKESIQEMELVLGATEVQTHCVSVEGQGQES